MKTLELTKQELDDLVSAVEWTHNNYPKEGAAEFRRDLRVLKHKLWEKIHEEPCEPT